MLCAVIVSLAVYVTFFVATRYLAEFIQLPGLTALRALPDRFLFISASMAVSALAALMVWDALALEPRLPGHREAGWQRGIRKIVAVYRTGPVSLVGETAEGALLERPLRTGRRSMKACPRGSRRRSWHMREDVQYRASA